MIFSPQSGFSVRQLLVSIYSRWQYGKVLSPINRLYGRIPGGLAVVQGLLSQRPFRHLNFEERQLIKHFVANYNHCEFCQDIALANLVKKQLGVQRMQQLHNFEQSDAFTDREISILSFIRQSLNEPGHHEDALHVLVNKIGEQAALEVCWLTSVECFFNRLNTMTGMTSDQLAEGAKGRTGGL